MFPNIVIRLPKEHINFLKKVIQREDIYYNKKAENHDELIVIKNGSLYRFSYTTKMHEKQINLGKESLKKISAPIEKYPYPHYSIAKTGRSDLIKNKKELENLIFFSQQPSEKAQEIANFGHLAVFSSELVDKYEKNTIISDFILNVSLKREIPQHDSIRYLKNNLLSNLISKKDMKNGIIVINNYYHSVLKHPTLPDHFIETLEKEQEEFTAFNNSISDINIDGYAYDKNFEYNQKLELISFVTQKVNEKPNAPVFLTEKEAFSTFCNQPLAVTHTQYSNLNLLQRNQGGANYYLTKRRDNIDLDDY